MSQVAVSADQSRLTALSLPDTKRYSLLSRHE
jgi:hypothetical protein